MVFRTLAMAPKSRGLFISPVQIVRRKEDAVTACASLRDFNLILTLQEPWLKGYKHEANVWE